MTEPAYPASRAVAASVQEYFARHLTAAQQQGTPNLPPAPDALTIEAIINAAFWASLRREEGYFPKISFALLPPERATLPLVFERLLPFTPSALTRLAPAVERPGIHLGVWRFGDELWVWGTTHVIPKLCFVLEVVEPGLLVIKYRRGQDPSKFVNVAVLKGDQIKVVDEASIHQPDCPTVLNSLLGFGAADPINVLVQLAASMRTHGRGGTLLVVPQGSAEWRQSILWPVPYAVSPPYAELAELMRQDTDKRRERPWQEALRRVVEVIAGLTAVDGATLMTDQYEVLAFGAKIRRRESNPPVEQILVTEPILGATQAAVHPIQLGGTRHLSAAQFVQDQSEALALVASQDGRFTVFAWSPCAGMVHAHRVETLLL